MIDTEGGFSFREAGRVIDLDDALLTLALAEVEAGLGGVGDDVATDGLLVVTGEEGGIRVGDDLVGDDDGGAVLVGQDLEGAEKATKFLLAVGEFTTTSEVGAEEGGGRIDDDEGEAVLGHHGGGLGEEVLLVVGVVGAGAGDVVKDIIGVEAEALGGGAEAFGAEGAFGVDVERHTFSAALFEGELAGDTEGVAELGLAGAELAEEFGDGAALEAAAEELVEFLGAGGDADELLAHAEDGGGVGEADGAELLGFLDEGFGLLVADALAVGDDLLGGEGNALDGVDAAFDQRLDVGALEAVLFEDLDAASIAATRDLFFFGLVFLMLLAKLASFVGRSLLFTATVGDDLDVIIRRSDFLLNLGTTTTSSSFSGHCLL